MKTQHQRPYPRKRVLANLGDDIRGRLQEIDADNHAYNGKNQALPTASLRISDLLAGSSHCGNRQAVVFGAVAVERPP